MAIMTIADDMLGPTSRPAESHAELTESAIWSDHNAAIWQADRFVGSPAFYPVYRYENYYSYSPLPLILLKGNLRLNSRAAKAVSRPDFRFYGGSDTIDKEIVRIGGPPIPGFGIVDADTYASRLAEAMCKDVASVEAAHPGYTNVILCGGKDSLNLTLLPWTNPVIVASAAPNYALVQAFMADNDLSFDLIRLVDEDDSLLQREILVNCCRNSLEHCRWGPQLETMSRTNNGRTIFWKGQLGDILMTKYWKDFAYKYSLFTKPLRKRGAGPFRYCLEESHITQRLTYKNLWTVGAMWQGSHNSILRELTDALVLSAYHGPAVQEVWSQIDLNRAVQQDIRPDVGAHLHGDVVVYPAKNPGPPPSEIRRGISDVQTFLKSLRSIGITVHD